VLGGRVTAAVRKSSAIAVQVTLATAGLERASSIMCRELFSPAVGDIALSTPVSASIGI